MRIKLPVNMPDSIRKHSGYGELWPLRPACSQNRAGSCMPDPTSSIRFFQRRHGPYCAKLTRIRSGWPGQGLAKLICSESKPVCRNHRARFLAVGNWPATCFPHLESIPFIQRRPGFYYTKPARIRFSSGWLCQVLAKRIRSGS